MKRGGDEQRGRNEGEREGKRWKEGREKERERGGKRWKGGEGEGGRGETERKRYIESE